MNREENILRAKKLKGLSWKDLAKELPISDNGLRTQFSRGSVDPFYLEHLERILQIDPPQNSTAQEPATPVYSKKPKGDEVLQAIEELKGIVIRDNTYIAKGIEVALINTEKILEAGSRHDKSIQDLRELIANIEQIRSK